MKKKINLKLLIFIIALISIIILPNFSFAAEKSTVIIIKQAIAMWYYILRTISIAVMLVILIFIGIKMAISTVASDKALYKSMLIDWVAGMILVFGIHYIMLFIINLNEIIVNTIKEASEAIYEANPSEYGGIENKDKSNNDIETSVFDAVRTRAYDPKLINGTTGMIMYAYLVYYAYKFSFKYLKRYLTVAVLTLMAPVVAVSYALNKVLTGKTQIFSTWLKEYIFNVFLQTIHALIYVVFVLMALRLSLNSISGMLLAFILLNYMSKADSVFRKIFGIGGSGSLVDDIADKDIGKELVDNARKLRKAYAGSKVIKAIARKERNVLFYKPAQKLFGAAMAFKQNHSKNANKNYHVDGKGEKTEFEESDFKKFSESNNEKLNKLLEIQRHKDAVDIGDIEELKKIRSEKATELGEDDDEVKELDDEINALETSSSDEEKEGKINLISAHLKKQEQVAFNEFSKTRLALAFSAKEKLSEVFDPSKYTEYDPEKGKYVGVRTKYKGRMVRDKNGVLRHVEARKRTPFRGWFSDEYEETDSIGKRMKQNINARTVLGMTEKDKILLNQDIKEIKDVTTGFLNGLFSLPMMIESPAIAINRMDKAIQSKNRLITSYNKKNQVRTLPFRVEGNTYNEQYQSLNEGLEKYAAEGHLSVQTMKQMRKAMTQELSTARDEYIVNDIHSKHTKLVKSMLKGTIAVGGGPIGMKLVRSVKRDTSSTNNVIRTGGLGYAEREHNLKQYDEQDKINRRTEAITMDKVLNNMFDEVLAGQKEKINSLNQDERLRQAAVEAGLAVMVGETLVPLTDEPITEELIIETLNAKKAENETFANNQKAKNAEEMEKVLQDKKSKKSKKSNNATIYEDDQEETEISSNTKGLSNDEIVEEAEKRVTNALIRKTIIQLSKENNNDKNQAITQFTTDDTKNQDRILEKLASTAMDEIGVSDDEIKVKIKERIDAKVSKVKTEMVLAEMTTESLKEAASEDDVKSVDDIKMEDLQSSVEEKMQEWSEINVNPNEGTTFTSQSVLNQLEAGRKSQSTDLDVTQPKIQIKLNSLGGKSIQDLVKQSVQARYQVMNKLNAKSDSNSDEKTATEMKNVLMAKQYAETQKLLADVLTESNEEKVQELLKGVSDDDATLAEIAIEMKKNNRMANKAGMKASKKLDYPDGSQTPKNSNDAIIKLQEQKEKELKSNVNSGINGPLTDFSELLRKLDT